MTLLETLALLTFILTLLGLIVDVIRLTVEVMAKFSRRKAMITKKIDRLQLPAERSIFLTNGMES